MTPRREWTPRSENPGLASGVYRLRDNCYSTIFCTSLFRLVAFVHFYLRNDNSLILYVALIRVFRLMEICKSSISSDGGGDDGIVGLVVVG